jgi:isocitrate lyase
VPTSAHISRLVASRFQLDLLQHTMLLIARTDAESARLLSSTVDARDHAYIRGVRTRLPDGSHRLALAEALDRAEAEGRSGAEIDNLEAKWLSEVKLTTFDEGKTSFRAGLFSFELTRFGFQRSSKRFRSQATFPRTRRRLLSSAIGRQLLESQTLRHGTLLRIFLVLNLTGTGIVRRSLLFVFPFCFDVNFGNIVPRTREGYYHTTGGIDAAVSRALAFAPWADMIWLETKTPDLKQAQSFARRIREKFPGKWLVYNLSPSFNWSAHGYSGMYPSQLNLPHSLL